MKKISLLLLLLASSIGFSQSPYPAIADNNGNDAAQQQAVNQNSILEIYTTAINNSVENQLEPEAARFAGNVQGVTNRGNCITEDFENYTLPPGLADILEVSMLDENTVVNGQGPGLVADGCVYVSPNGPIQWNDEGYFGQLDKNINSNSLDGVIILQYDLTVDAIDFNLSAYNGFPESVTIDILNDSGGSLGTLGPIAVPVGIKVPVSIAATGISSLRIMGINGGPTGFSPLVNDHVFCPDGSVSTNDLCIDAVAVACNDTFTGNTSVATDTNGNDIPDVWYSYTGTVAGQNVTFSLCDGTGFDSVLRVFDACDGAEIDVNDDFCGTQSQLTFTSDGSSTYLIMVEGSDGDSGAFSLTVSCDPDNPAENDLCDDAIPITCGEFILGDTSTSTDTGGNLASDVWYSYTGDGESLPITLSLCGDETGFDSVIRVFEVCGGAEIGMNDDFCGEQSELTFTSDGTSTYLIMIEGSGSASTSGAFRLAVSCNPENDLCEDAIAVACGDTVTGQTSSATTTGGNPAPDVWYSYTGTGLLEDVTVSLCDGGTDYDSFIRVFNACGGTEVAANDDSCGVQSEATFTSDGTSTYLIMVEGFSSRSGNYSLAVTCEISIPDNDDCANAIPVVCREAVTGNTALATNSVGNAAPDLWYSFTGLDGVTQEVTASLCGSSFDTFIRVFDACGGNEIASNDDSCGLQSELTFTSDGTSTYLIMVEGFASGSGDFTLEISCSPDDPINYTNCLDAIDMNCGDTFTGETVTAEDSNNNFAGDVFFSFTGEGVMQDITVSLCDDITDYDTNLFILDECDGNIIAESDDFCGDQSQITFTSDGTSRYIIMVDGGFFASGNFKLSISCSPGDPGSNDNCEDAISVGCGNNVILGDTSIGTDTGGNAAPDLWYSFTGDGNDQDVTLSLCGDGTAFDSLIRVFDECGGTEIAVNNDFCGLQSELTFTSVGTSTYFIMIEGSGSSAGAFSLAVSSADCPVPCANPNLEINQDAGDACLAFLFQAGVVQSYQPVEAVSSGAGFKFLNAPGAGTDLTLTLYDALPSDGGVALGSGTTIADGAAVWLDVFWIVSPVVPGDTYYIGLTGTAGECLSGATTSVYPGGNLFVGVNDFPNVDLTFRTYSCEPLGAIANDDCADAIAIDCGATVTGSTLEATDTGGNAAPDVWYSFTGTGNEQDVTLSLCDGGTDFDSLIRVFDACGGTEIATNDDFCGTQSELTFTSVGASTYLIMIEGFGPNAGAFSLEVSCAVLGDLCDDSSLEINQDFGETCLANISQGGIAQSYQPIEAESSGAGFQFVNAPSAGTDLTLTLYDALPSSGGTALATGTTVADGTGVWLDVFWPITAVVPGDTYFIGVTGSADECLNGALSNVYLGGNTFSGGNTFPNFDFTFRTYSCDSTSGVVNDNCVDAIAVDCGATVTGSTSDATDSGGNISGDLFYSYTGIGVQEEITISLCDGSTDYDSLLRVFDDGCLLVSEIAVNDDFCGTQSELTFISDGTTTYTIMVEGFGPNTGNFTMSVICEPLGIDDIDFARFNYYPNPANETINFSSQENIDSITIYNILGQQVLVQSVNAISGQLNVFNLRSGTYIMEVTFGSKTVAYKVIKR